MILVHQRTLRLYLTVYKMPVITPGPIGLQELWRLNMLWYRWMFSCICFYASFNSICNIWSQINQWKFIYLAFGVMILNNLIMHDSDDAGCIWQLVNSIWWLWLIIYETRVYRLETMWISSNYKPLHKVVSDSSVKSLHPFKWNNRTWPSNELCDPNKRFVLNLRLKSIWKIPQNHTKNFMSFWWEIVKNATFKSHLNRLLWSHVRKW